MQSSVVEELRRLRRELLIQRVPEPSIRDGAINLYITHGSIIDACLSALDEKS